MVWRALEAACTFGVIFRQLGARRNRTAINWGCKTIAAPSNDPPKNPGLDPAMRVTAIETIRIDEFPNLLWVQVHTDGG